MNPGYGRPYPFPGQKPPANGSDIGWAIVAIIGTAALAVWGFFLAVGTTLFNDSCRGRCDAGLVATTGMVTLGVVVVIGVCGMVAAFHRIARRRTSWPFSVGTLVLCTAALVIGWNTVAAFAAP